MINVMIVEDQEMTRQLIEMMLKDSEDYKIAKSISNADMALFYCDLMKIDLILMDVCTAHDASGIEASERIKKKYPHIKIIVITSMPEFSWMDRCRGIGVEGFWYKNVSKIDLVTLMGHIMAGEVIYPDNTPELPFGYTTNHDFSRRELEILKELTTGDSNAVIGEKLGISQNTVRNCIQVMMEKTGFRSRTELAVEARRLGMVIKEKEF